MSMPWAFISLVSVTSGRPAGNASRRSAALRSSACKTQRKTRAGLSLLDGADHRRVVRLAPSRGGGGLQQPPRRSRLLERDARGLGQLDGVRQVFQDVPRGEGALRRVMVG